MGPGRKEAGRKERELNTGAKIVSSFTLLTLSSNPADGVMSPTFSMGLLEYTFLEMPSETGLASPG